MTDTRQFTFDNRIAPRDTTPTTSHFLEEMLRGAYDHGTVLRYHDYDLSLVGSDQNVWRVDPAPHTDRDATTAAPTDSETTTRDDTPIEVLNLADFRSITTLGRWLRRLADRRPTTRAEWPTDHPTATE
jgi:hypothetical protein